MVVAHFFESGPATPSTLGAESRSAPLNGPAQVVALASTGYIAAIDEKAWAGATSGSARAVQGSPQREPALPTETAREAEYARRKVRVILFGAGGWIRSPSCGRRGTGCSPANGTPEELRTTGSSLRVINSFYRSGSTMIYRKSSAQKSLGCLRIET